MTWPAWIDAIKTSYLNDEASVFLLHGAVRGAHWTVDGEALSCTELLQRFLGRTRPVVGVLTAEAGLHFQGIGDSGTFDRLVSAVELLTQRAQPLKNRDPLQALGRIWLALGSTGSAQAYVLADVDTLLPAHRKRVDPIPAQAPPLWAWCSHERVRRSNNILVLLTPELDAVREELVHAAHAISVVAPLPPREAAPPVAQVEDAPQPTPSRADDDAAATSAEAEIEAFLARAKAPTETSPSGGDLSNAIKDALATHPVSTWSARLPVIDAVSRVLATTLPERVGEIVWAVDDEGQLSGTGPGADWLLERWNADIALDAAAGMLLGELVIPEGAERIDPPETLSATALKALQRRLDKLVASSAQGR